MAAKISEDVKERYIHGTAKYRPATPFLRNFIAAFFIGGLICLVGQALHEAFVSQGLSDVEAGARMAVVVILLGGLFTGLGFYDRLGKIGGAGSAVPISGFANAVTSSAMEFARDGFVLGMGAHFFVVIGPVLVTGITSAVVFTIIRFLIINFGG